MNTKTRSATRDLVLAALFLALAFVLPMITGHVPQIGNMLCPMHFPVLLPGTGLCRPAAPLGAVRDAPDVPHCHRHGL